MKFLIFGFLLLTLRRTLADDASSMPSEKCLNEINKYNGCLESIDDTFMNSMETSETLKKFCSNFDNDKCTNFITDATKAESACLSKDNTNMVDQFSGLIYTTLKVTYSAYCAKGSDGKTCPFSEYLVENVATIDNTTDLDDAGRKALANDCRDSKCHDRLMSLKDISSLLDSIGDDDTSTDTTTTTTSSSSIDNLEKYFENYSKNQCGAIDGSSSSSDASTIIRFTFSGIALVIISLFMLI